MMQMHTQQHQGSRSHISVHANLPTMLQAEYAEL
jgi:hypothetical protein